MVKTPNNSGWLLVNSGSWLLVTLETRPLFLEIQPSTQRFSWDFHGIRSPKWMSFKKEPSPVTIIHDHSNYGWPMLTMKKNTLKPPASSQFRSLRPVPGSTWVHILGLLPWQSGTTWLSCRKMQDSRESDVSKHRGWWQAPLNISPRLSKHAWYSHLFDVYGCLWHHINLTKA